jgi:hypothetical protein
MGTENVDVNSFGFSLEIVGTWAVVVSKGGQGKVSITVEIRQNVDFLFDVQIFPAVLA